MGKEGLRKRRSEGQERKGRLKGGGRGRPQDTREALHTENHTRTEAKMLSFSTP